MKLSALRKEVHPKLIWRKYSDDQAPLVFYVKKERDSGKVGTWYREFNLDRQGGE